MCRTKVESKLGRDSRAHFAFRASTFLLVSCASPSTKVPRRCLLSRSTFPSFSSVFPARERNRGGIVTNETRALALRRSARLNIPMAGEHAAGKRPRYTFFAVVWTGNVASLARCPAKSEISLSSFPPSNSFRRVLRFSFLLLPPSLPRTVAIRPIFDRSSDRGGVSRVKNAGSNDR